MAAIPFLIIFPFVVAVIMFCVRYNPVRNTIAYASAIILMLAVGYLLVDWVSQGTPVWTISYHAHAADMAILAGEIVLAAAVALYRERRYHGSA